LADGSEEYLLKWLNYGSCDNSWEPRANIAPGLIEKFERKQQRKETERKAVIVQSSRVTVDDDGDNKQGKESNSESKSEGNMKQSSSCEDYNEQAGKVKQEVKKTYISRPKALLEFSCIFVFLYQDAKLEENSNETDDEEVDYDKAFDLGFQVDEIIGVSMGEDNKPVFLIKWKGNAKASQVPAKVANHRYSKEVIEFYEERMFLYKSRVV